MTKKPLGSVERARVPAIPGPFNSARTETDGGRRTPAGTCSTVVTRVGIPTGTVCADGVMSSPVPMMRTCPLPRSVCAPAMAAAKERPRASAPLRAPFAPDGTPECFPPGAGGRLLITCQGLRETDSEALRLSQPSPSMHTHRFADLSRPGRTSDLSS
jgi:hypothetical protein